MSAARLGFVLGLGLLVAGCVPLTLSSEDAIDFQEFRSIYVGPVTGVLSSKIQLDIVTQLERRSGFEVVTIDPGKPTDLELWVDVQAVEYWDLESSGLDCFTQYFARRTSGGVILEGEFELSGDSFGCPAGDIVDRIVEKFQRRYEI